MELEEKHTHIYTYIYIYIYRILLLGPSSPGLHMAESMSSDLSTLGPNVRILHILGAHGFYSNGLHTWGPTLGLQVCKEYLIWALKYGSRTYFGLLGAQGQGSVLVRYLDPLGVKLYEQKPLRTNTYTSPRVQIANSYGLRPQKP